MYYLYSATLRYEGVVEHPDDCPASCMATTEEPPPAPWPDGHWPYYMEDGWELAEVNPD